MNARIRQSVGRVRIRGHAVIAIAVALSAFVFPDVAQAHGRSTVVALDYVARPAASGEVAPGIRARVIDGDRKLELSVLPSREVVVRGYGEEPFLRFSALGVQVNVDSPTAIANRLVSGGAIAAVGSGAPARWKVLTKRHRLTWHDHRLGPRSGLRPGEGRVGEWAIPIVADGKPAAIQGGLWRATKPTVLPWLAIWLATVAAAGAVLRLGTSRMRRSTVYLAAVIAVGGLLLVSAGFAAATGRSRIVLWGELAFPAALAVAAGAAFFLRPRQRYIASAVVAGFAFAAALEDVSVFWHGFVVSSLPAQIARAGVATTLAAAAYAVAVVLADLMRDEPVRLRRPRPRPRLQPRLAIPKGKPR